MKLIFLIFITLNFIFATTDLETQKLKISEVTQTTAKIKKTNLIVGQSGIVVKNINNHNIILTHAIITASNKNDSTIEFTDTVLLKQDAIPTSNFKASVGDTFILNHLYNTTLLIVPNAKAKTIVQNLYPNQNFLNEDFFASHLKLLKTPLPTKEIFTNFGQNQQIGTLFFVVENSLYILDALTFKVIDTIAITNDDTSVNVPFLTKIEQIEQGFFDFGDEEIKDYNKYYLKLLEIK